MSSRRFLALLSVPLVALLLFALILGAERIVNHQSIVCGVATPPAYPTSPSLLLTTPQTTVSVGTVIEVRTLCSTAMDWKSLQVSNPGVLQTLSVQAKDGNVFGEFVATQPGRSFITPVEAHPGPPPPLGAMAPGVVSYLVIVQATS